MVLYWKAMIWLLENEEVYMIFTVNVCDDHDYKSKNECRV